MDGGVSRVGAGFLTILYRGAEFVFLAKALRREDRQECRFGMWDGLAAWFWLGWMDARRCGVYVGGQDRKKSTMAGVLGVEAVAGAADGEDVFGVLGVFFDFLAEPGDVNVDGAGGDVGLVLPHLFENFFAG